MGILLAACVVAQLRYDSSLIGITAIDKRPAAGRVRVNRLGLRGDVQADRRHHGGELKALYAYADEDAVWWANELGRELAHGWFGENLRLSGIDVNGARIGERWRIGEGERPVEVEVTMPRTPCMTFARHVGGEHATGWVKRFADERRLGAYLRVVRTGAISAGDEVTVTDSPADAPTVAEVFRMD